jgi:DNA-binding NtrC family response regulator
MAAEHVRPLREVERDYIEAVLERYHGNRTLTTRQLEMAPDTLFRKLKAYADGQLTRPGPAPRLPLWPE